MRLSAPATAATVLAQAPDPGGQGEDFGKSSPVGLVLLIIFFIAVAFLVRSMTKHLRKLPTHFDEERAAAAAPARVQRAERAKADEKADEAAESSEADDDQSTKDAQESAGTAGSADAAGSAGTAGSTGGDSGGDADSASEANGSAQAR